MIDTVVFDIGNVLIGWDPRHAYRSIFDDEAEMEWFLTEVCPNAWNLEQDRGRSWEAAIAEAIGRHPAHAEAIRAYRSRWHDMVSGEIIENVTILERLRAADVPVYAITNFAADTFDEARARFPFLNGFRDTVISAIEGVVKPDPRIYQFLLERTGLDPAQTVFIDDSPANVLGARAVGMSAIHYEPSTDLATELRKFGLPV